MPGHQVARERGAGKAWLGDGRCPVEERPGAPLLALGKEKKVKANIHPGRALVLGCVQRAKERGFTDRQEARGDQK